MAWLSTAWCRSRERRFAVSDVVVKRFAVPDERRDFVKGNFELLRVGNMTVGRASYEPGWKWSEHVGPTVGSTSCNVDHVGMVVTGRAMVRMDDGREFQLTPGDVFAIGPGHDSWVVGNEPYVSLHFIGADSYAK
jgi:quercetin dioxygenase-like cupin family protein